MGSVEMTMPVGGFLSHPLVGVMLYNVLVAWPLWRIYRRAGLPPQWSLIAFVPFIGMVLVVAVFGHARWPNLPARPATRSPKTRRDFPSDGA